MISEGRLVNILMWVRDAHSALEAATLMRSDDSQYDDLVNKALHRLDNAMAQARLLDVPFKPEEIRS